MFTKSAFFTPRFPAYRCARPIVCSLCFSCATVIAAASSRKSPSGSTAPSAGTSTASTNSGSSSMGVGDFSLRRLDGDSGVGFPVSVVSGPGAAGIPPDLASASARHAFIKSSELPCDFRAGEMSSPLLRSSSRRVVAYAARFSASAARRSASRLAVSAVAVLAAA